MQGTISRIIKEIRSWSIILACTQEKNKLRLLGLNNCQAQMCRCQKYPPNSVYFDKRFIDLFSPMVYLDLNEKYFYAQELTDGIFALPNTSGDCSYPQISNI